MPVDHLVLRTCLCFVLALSIAIVSGSSECTDYEFPCENGQCIDAALWCDAHVDCFDKSDEKYCRKASLFNSNPNKCPSAYFKCSNGPCIPLMGLCDGYANCQDSSDEEKCESEVSSPKSDSTPSPSKPATPLLEITSEAATSTMTTSTGQPTPMVSNSATPQTPVKLDSHATYFSDSPDALQHSLEIAHSDIQPSSYSHQREIARNWLLSQRRSDFGWGDETPRAITALYLSDTERPIRKNESDMLMLKQLQVQLALAMARNGTKAMKQTDLALYINALLASCQDPQNFFGENLVNILRNSVNAAQREAIFVNPSVYLTLCLNNATTYEDKRRLDDMFVSRNVGIGRMDIQALTFLTATCIFKNGNLISAPMLEGTKRLFFSRMNATGFPGNVYEASLLAQALQESRANRSGLVELLLRQQNDDGSFGGILATYLALPVLAGRSFLQMTDHCSQRYATDLMPIEALKNPKRIKMYIQYSLKYGYPPEVTETIQMQVAEGINFLDIMRLAEEINPKFRFMLDGNRDVPVVYSIGGIPNDAEKGTFWSLHVFNKDKGRLVPYSENIKKLIPRAGDEFVFWIKSL